MSEARDHHFVPQFYLRRFSDDGKSINLFNFRAGRTITGAAIKGQCQKRGLHDWSAGLEERLAAIEQLAAKALNRVAETGQPPKLFSRDDALIKFFIILQKCRTLKIGEQYDTYSAYRAEILLSHGVVDHGNSAEKSEMGDKESIRGPMQMYIHNGKYISDLQPQLFVNDTSFDFLTSDHPAITHNQYSEAVKDVGVLGLACVGIQLWLPLSPRLLYMVYDQTAYRVGASRRERTTHLTDPREVQNFNGFQILNAQSNIYFRCVLAAPDVEASARALVKKRLEKRLQFARFAREEEDGSRSEMLVQHERQTPISLDISSISVQRSRRRVPPTKRYKMWRFESPRHQDEEWWPEEYTHWVSYPIEKIERR